MRWRASLQAVKTELSKPLNFVMVLLGALMALVLGWVALQDLHWSAMQDHGVAADAIVTGASTAFSFTLPEGDGIARRPTERLCVDFSTVAEGYTGSTCLEVPEGTDAASWVGRHISVKYLEAERLGLLLFNVEVSGR